MGQFAYSAWVGSILFISSIASASSLPPDVIPPNPNKPQLIVATTSQVFTPMGFDDNDNAQIVLYGQFPNTCYKVAHVDTVVDTKTREIRVTPYAFYYPGCWCLEVLVPYTQVVNLGFLSHGNFKIRVMAKDSSSREMATIPIAASTNPGPDDHLYAPVREATVETSDTGAKTLVLRGNFSSTCVRFQETRVMNRTPGVIEVLPILSVSADGCRDAQIPFEIKVALQSTHPGENLIHIRSLNGQSINLITEF